MKLNQKNNHIFKTIRHHVFQDGKIKFEIPIDYLSELNLMTCPFCSYQTNKTSNFDRHKKTCPKNRGKQFIENKIYFSINSTKIYNNPTNKQNDKSCIQNISITDQTNNYEDDKSNKTNIKIIKNMFKEASHLNCQEISFGNYFVFDKHSINSGTYGTVFFGSVKETNIKVAIKEIKDYDVYLLEKGILSDIRGIGNFPEYYDSVERWQKYYIIESLTGPSLDLLLSICDGTFDLYTTLNIAIDVISNLEALHKQGYVHRDLKPNNLFFGSLSKNKIHDKLNIGILDFGSSASVEKQEKSFNKKGKYFRYSKKIYSSDNVLDNKPFQRIDDLISIFYILIRLHTGSLPWMENRNEKNNIDCESIKQIREKFTPEILCKNFPKKFKQQYERIIKLPQNEIPDYSDIISSFKAMKQEYINFFGERKYKFEWMNKLEYFNDGNNILLTESSIYYIKEFISKYGLNLSEYLNFLKN